MNLNKREGHFLWTEAYRPQRIDECVLPERIRGFAKDIVAAGQLPHILMSGGPGCGKTTLAKALCNELGLDFLLINASENGNIDTLRTTIRSYASTVSFTSEYKVVILDESDSLSGATMNALRGFLEEFANNCRFILTCNYSNKIIEPLKSRCTNIDFSFTRDEKQRMLMDFDRRTKEILNIESVEYEKKDLAQIIIRHFPDFRRVLNELQRFTSSGSLDGESSSRTASDSIQELYSYLKDPSKWNDMRKWVAQNSDLDFDLVYRALYDKASDHLEPASIPQLVLHIAEYQYRSGFVADKEITLVACLTSLMSDCTFR